MITHLTLETADVKIHAWFERTNVMLEDDLGNRLVIPLAMTTDLATTIAILRDRIKSMPPAT